MVVDDVRYRSQVKARCVCMTVPSVVRVRVISFRISLDISPENDSTIPKTSEHHKQRYGNEMDADDSSFHCCQGFIINKINRITSSGRLV